MNRLVAGWPQSVARGERQDNRERERERVEVFLQRSTYDLMRGIGGALYV